MFLHCPSSSHVFLLFNPFSHLATAGFRLCLDIFLYIMATSMLLAASLSLLSLFLFFGVFMHVILFQSCIFHFSSLLNFFTFVYFNRHTTQLLYLTKCRTSVWKFMWGWSFLQAHKCILPGCNWRIWKFLQVFFLGFFCNVDLLPALFQPFI